MKESFAAFKELVVKFPESRYAQDATERMLYLTNRWASTKLTSPAITTTAARTSRRSTGRRRRSSAIRERKQTRPRSSVGEELRQARAHAASRRLAAGPEADLPGQRLPRGSAAEALVEALVAAVGAFGVAEWGEGSLRGRLGMKPAETARAEFQTLALRALAEKRLDVLDFARTPHGRQALPDAPAIGLVGQAGIANHQHPAVGLRADQAPRALLQRDGRLR